MVTLNDMIRGYTFSFMENEIIDDRPDVFWDGRVKAADGLVFQTPRCLLDRIENDLYDILENTPEGTAASLHLLEEAAQMGITPIMSWLDGDETKLTTIDLDTVKAIPDSWANTIAFFMRNVIYRLMCMQNPKLMEVGNKRHKLETVKV